LWKRSPLPGSDAIKIVIDFTTKNGDRVVPFRGWTGRAGLLTLEDDLGNEYRMGSHQPAPLGLRSDRPASETLIFDLPLPNAHFLYFSLSKEPLGEQGEIGFKFSRSMWTEDKKP